MRIRKGITLHQRNLEECNMRKTKGPYSSVHDLVGSITAGYVQQIHTCTGWHDFDIRRVSLGNVMQAVADRRIRKKGEITVTVTLSQGFEVTGPLRRKR